MYTTYSSSRKRLLISVFVLALLSGCGDNKGDQSSEDSSAESAASSIPSQNATDILLEKDAAQSSAPAEKSQDSATLTLPEAQQFIKSLPPSELGLSGKSMGEYLIHPEEGVVLVDGETCVKICVYSQAPATQTNQIAGIYLLARDKTHLYRVENDGQEITELQVTGLTPAEEPAQEPK